jgi:hypothetical protein
LKFNVASESQRESGKFATKGDHITYQFVLLIIFKEKYALETIKLVGIDKYRNNYVYVSVPSVEYRTKLGIQVVIPLKKW